MTVGPRHATTIGVIQQQLLKVLVDEEVAIRVQQPVTLSESEPEPDVSIVRGSLSDYMTHHPCQEDVLLCIEVSDSSLKYDRTTKLQVYARAGIPEYWIVNLNEEHVEVYRTPDPSAGTFLEDFIVPRKSFLSLNIDDQSVELAISELLPC
ncbi:MAG: Uma2 family endonuclease, partial [Planctomycetaceae bacterium]|nr:Uma2 family endonuclease [Planctomycetaceae bacterium]